jgi:CheY-like chemotaxis protein
MTINTKMILEFSKGLRILYVEDDEVLAKITTKIFSTYFNNVDVAVNGEEGLTLYNEYKKETGDNYDLVFTDINMPIRDGISMSQEIKQGNPDQTIVFITASNEISRIQDAINVGSSGFLIKPVSLEQLQVVLYATAQKVFEHKLVLEYYEEIESLNMQLQNKNEELQERNKELEKSFRMLNTVVEKEAIKEAKQTPVNKENQEDGVSYNEQLDELEQADIIELAEICIDIDGAIISILGSNGDSQISQNSLPLIIESFNKFSSIISYYTVFNNLAVALSSFVESLKSSPLPATQNEVINIFTLLESFVFVLKKWQTNLQNRKFESINYLDASLISDMNTIILMYNPSS